MAERDRAAFARKNIAWLGPAFIACLLWSATTGNAFAGLTGIIGIGWLAWAYLKKPKS